MKTILFLIIFSGSILAQTPNFKVRQITNVDGDARNPFIPAPYFNQTNESIFFEIHKNGTSNIVTIGSDDISGTLFSPVFLTNDLYSNINPRCIESNGNMDFNEFLFFQTNRTGHWQIAYKIKKGNIWSSPNFIDTSSVDETDPEILYISPEFTLDSVRVLYERGNSIYLATFQDTSFYCEKVFEGNDSVLYSQPTGMPYVIYTATYTTKLLVDVVAKKVVNSKSVIVYKTKDDSSGIWGKEEVVVDSGECNNPKFIGINTYSSSLSYENKLNNYSNIYLIDGWGTTSAAQAFRDSVNGNLTDLVTWRFYGIMDKPLHRKNNYDIYNLYGFRYQRNDSTFISTSKYPSYFNTTGNVDTLIYTKVKNTGLAVGPMTVDSGSISVVWEDSANGHIQLFGAGLDHIVGIKQSTKPIGFQLYQNYPNPFNPSTKIKFYLVHNGFVKLTIYNILGQKIKELINGYMYSGNHEVNFNADALGLASGVYLYQLKAGDNITAKKMILLK